MALRLLAPLWLAALSVVFLLHLLFFARRRTRPLLPLVVRSLLLSALVLALAQPIWIQTEEAAGAQGSRLVIVLDQSASLQAEGAQALRQAAQAILDQYPSTPVIIAGQRPIIVADLSLAQTFTSTQVLDASDLGAALEMAGMLLGQGGGRVVLLSDGQDTAHRAFEIAQQLAASNVVVDFVPYLNSEARNDVSIDQLSVPPYGWLNAPIDLQAVIASSVPQRVSLSLRADGVQPIQQDVDMQPGSNVVTLQVQPSEVGLTRFEVSIQSSRDPQPRNNYAFGATAVYTQSAVLYISAEQRGAPGFRRALRDQGLLVDDITPVQFPSQMLRLRQYQAIIIDDIPFDNFRPDHLAAIREYVYSEGRGLVLLGGQQSFSLGGYKDTILDELSPLEMDPPPKPDEEPVALLVILDHSGSMAQNSKLTLAQQAAILALEGLRPQDRFGLLAFTTDIEWTVAFQSIGQGTSARDIKDRIGQLGGTGGTALGNPLEAGLADLTAQTAGKRLAIILTDGQSFDQPEKLRAIVQPAQAAGITLSSIAIGSDADDNLLRQLAEWGSGRFHKAIVPANIPKILIDESGILRTEPTKEGNYNVLLPAPHPLLKDFDPITIPPLSGYLALRPKLRSEIVLTSPDGDPLLATWQFGLGRVVAWTSDIGDKWAASWPGWSDYGRFWAQVARYTFGDPRVGDLRFEAKVVGRQADLSVESQLDGRWVQQAPATAIIEFPNGDVVNVPLLAEAPGAYRRQIELDSDGVYSTTVVQDYNGVRREVAESFVISYADEYRPASENGLSLLQQIAQVTGGTEWQAIALPIRTRQSSTGSSSSIVELWPWLLAAAAILWPLDIVVRRRWMPWPARQ